MSGIYSVFAGIDPDPVVLGGLLLYSLKATLVVVLALLAASLMGKASPLKRNLLLRAAVAAVLALPLITIVVPAWNVGIFGSVAKVINVAHSTVTPVGAETAGAAATTTPGIPWAGILFAIWLIGAAVIAARAVIGSAISLATIRSARPAGTNLTELYARLSSAVGVNRRVRLVLSRSTSMPFAVGIFSPVIVLPELAEQWPIGNARMVLLHELAHIKRHDIVWTVLGSLALAVHWFNPLVWMIRKRLLIEAEKTCDDYVISAGTGPLVYAEHLLAVARDMDGRRLVYPLGAGMARKTQLEGRLMSVLSKRVHSAAAGRALIAIVIIVAAAVVIPLACLQAGVNEDPSPAINDQQETSEPSDSLPGPNDFVAVDVLPEMIKTVNAQYPEEAKAAGDSGVVYIKALIDKTGKVREVQIGKSSGYKILDEAAARAAWQCEFKPAVSDGKPVATWITYSVHFTLAEPKTKE